MFVLDHLSITVRDLACVKPFYEAVMTTLDGEKESDARATGERPGITGEGSDLLHQVGKRRQGGLGSFSGSNDDLFVVTVGRVARGENPAYSRLPVTVYLDLSSFVGLN